MKFTRNLPTQTRRDAWVEVNLGAIEKNTARIRQYIPSNVELMAIVKADAYGHGAVMSIPTLEASGVSMVGVASMDEAIQIRNAGLEIPILVIGLIPGWAVQAAIDHNIQLTVFSEEHLETLKTSYSLTNKPAKVHIKVDTGMHRIGIESSKAVAFVRHCQSLPHIRVEGVFSHLACAEDPQVTEIQLTRWKEIISQLTVLPRYLHLANSTGSLCYPDCHFNLARLGIAFYGYGPHLSKEAQKILQPQFPILTPAMGLKGRIVHLQEVPPETGVSYNYTYRTQDMTKIATLPLGYADGIPRILSNQIEGLLRGVRVPQVGNITMDQMMFDVSAVPEPLIGEAITLIGQDGSHRITLTDWAEKAQTLEYELMCSLRVRLPKIYTRD